MFREIIDRIKEAIDYILQSRLVVLIVVFCLSSSVLVGRLFYLQIVKGEDYLENYELQIRRTKDIPATRGNILTATVSSSLTMSLLIPSRSRTGSQQIRMLMTRIKS